MSVKHGFFAQKLSVMTTINIIERLISEVEEQAAITRTFLPLVPEDKYEWAPHEKSMKMVNLASHIAELNSWISMTLHTDELDFAAADYKPKVIKSNQDLSDILEKDLKTAIEDLKNAKEDDLTKEWTLRTGDTIHGKWDKLGVIRMSMNQIVHHRAQLGVYFRLLGIAVPPSFGPTADHQNF